MNLASSPCVRRSLSSAAAHCFAVIIIALVLDPANRVVQAAPAGILSQLSLAKPCAALTAFADTAHLPLRTFVPPTTRPLAPGDRVVMLVQLRERDRIKQWLIALTAAALNDAEEKLPPPPDLVMNLNGGGELRFSNRTRLALDIVVAGPATVTTTAGELTRTQSRALMSTDLLAVGLDASCRTMLRFKTVGADYKPTSDELRSAMSFSPALVAFMQTMQSTAGLREVLWAVVEKPSLWSIARHAGIDTMINLTTDISRASAEDWAYVAPAETFAMPVEVKLNDQTALAAELFVTAPQPPLLTCAGIIGVRAHSPKHPERHVEIWIVGTSRLAAAAR